MFSNKPSTNNFLWLYSHSNNLWSFMDDTFAIILENNYKKVLVCEYMNYKYDFAEMTQINIKTNKKRFILRITMDELIAIKKKYINFINKNNNYGCIINNTIFYYQPYIQKALKTNKNIEVIIRNNKYNIDINNKTQTNIKTGTKHDILHDNDINIFNYKINYSFNVL